MKMIVVIMMIVYASVAMSAEESKIDIINTFLGDTYFTKTGSFDVAKLNKTFKNEKQIKSTRIGTMNLFGKFDIYNYDNRVCINYVINPKLKSSDFYNTFADVNYAINKKTIIEYYAYVYNNKFNSIYFTLYNAGVSKASKAIEESKFNYDNIKNNIVDGVKKIFGEPAITTECYVTKYKWNWNEYTFEVMTSDESEIGKVLITFNIIDESNVVKIPENWREILKNNVELKYGYQGKFKEYIYLNQDGSNCGAFSKTRTLWYYGVNVNVRELDYLHYDVLWNRNNHWKTADIVRTVAKTIEDENSAMKQLNKMYKTTFVVKYLIKDKNVKKKNEPSTYMNKPIVKNYFENGFPIMIGMRKPLHSDNAFEIDIRNDIFKSWMQDGKQYTEFTFKENKIDTASVIVPEDM